MSGKKQVIVIRKSCITGRAVWIYRGPSRNAAYVAYSRACRKEVQRVRNWSVRVAERRAFILGLLNEWLADIPITQPLTPQQEAAAKEIRALAIRGVDCELEFYNHIMEERRRRMETRRLGKK